MSGLRQVGLVAVREMRERSRSRGFWVGLILMLVVVVAAIAVPALLAPGKVTRHVGFTGATPDELPRAVTEQGEAVEVTVRVHRYDGLAAGEEAVRDEDVDVLVVAARRLEWRGTADERLRAVVTGAIQLVAVRERAAAAGIAPDELLALVAPVAVKNVELGLMAGRSPDNEAAAAVMSVLLLVAIVTYGNLVLTGVVEEKASRVVEVLLARIPARNLLAGKVAGIGLLGFGQFAVTALAALAATLVVDSVDIPAVSGGVLAWVVVWFVLGYAVFAMAYGAVGSLASRTEDASSVSGPVTFVLLACYWAAYIAVVQDPGSGWTRLMSFFPATAPFAMPGRVALGAAAWWEPLVAAAIALAALAGLVVFAGRVYTGGILHAGPTLKLRDAWQRATTTSGRAVPETGSPRIGTPPPASATAATATDRSTIGATIVAVGVGAAVAVLGHDVVMGVAVGAALFVLVTRVARTRALRRARHTGQP